MKKKHSFQRGEQLGQRLGRETLQGTAKSVWLEEEGGVDKWGEERLARTVQS